MDTVLVVNATIGFSENLFLVIRVYFKVLCKSIPGGLYTRRQHSDCPTCWSF